MSSHPVLSRGVLLLACLASCACSAEYYRKDADAEVGGILLQRQLELFGDARSFNLDPRDMARKALQAELESRREERAEYRAEGLPDPVYADAESVSIEVGEERPCTDDPGLNARLLDIAERYGDQLQPLRATDLPLLPTLRLTLLDCLDVAADNNRDYQRQKENVYLEALDLTFDRYLFENRFSVDTEYQLSSTPSVLPGGRIKEGELSTSFSLTRLLGTGGLLMVDFTNDLLRRFTGITFVDGKRTNSTSLLDLAFSQPLLRGYGQEVVTEPLVQAERDVYYALRDFERFRREFAVEVATDYYNLLQDLDQIENSRCSFLQFISAREEQEARQDRGRTNRIQVDQARQRELNAKQSWLLATESYENGLDLYKITLGLPMESNLGMELAYLEQLLADGLPEALKSEEEAIEIALSQRLDHLNRIGRLRDAERQVYVAQDALRVGLDVFGSYNMAAEDNTAFDFRDGEASWTVGGELNLPIGSRGGSDLDSMINLRNVYRSQLIDEARAKRDLSLGEDEIKEQVRRDLRRLDVARESYVIQQNAVANAQTQVEFTTRALRMGRIQVRDALDATDDLTAARNALTGVVVNYLFSRLQLYLDMGLLRLTAAGIELLDPDDVRRAGWIPEPLGGEEEGAPDV